jgi:two-component system chemotaxis response regulator CheY
MIAEITITGKNAIVESRRGFMFNLAGKTILVADDSAVMRMFLIMNLKRLLTVDIIEAVNGRDALNKLENGKVDLVLTDMNMPEMGGAELIREVRTRLKSDVPIVIITTKGEVADRDCGMSLGANGYLTKPVGLKELITAVLKFAGGYTL